MYGLSNLAERLLEVENAGPCAQWNLGRALAAAAGACCLDLVELLCHDHPNSICSSGASDAITVALTPRTLGLLVCCENS